MQSKECPYCHNIYDATLANFYKGQAKYGLTSLCKTCHRKRGKVNGAKYRKAHADKISEVNKKRNLTINGRLHNLHSAMTFRCNTRQLYIDKGIQNKFESPKHLIDYVVNILQVDPRGLDCHRIDDNGSYEKGNIEFLGHSAHRKLHARK